MLVSVTAFLGYVWLREHLAASGEPEWLTEVIEGTAEADGEEAAGEAPPNAGAANPDHANQHQEQQGL